MKIFLILTIMFCLYLNAHAVAVLNENVANSGVMTIYPDHADPNRFYIAPNIVRVSQGNHGKPVFSYYELAKGEYSIISGGKPRKGYTAIESILQLTLAPAYTRLEFEEAKQQILRKNPKAEFSGIPFVHSELALTGLIESLIERADCNHQAGLIGQEQSCTVLLSDFGRKAFLTDIHKQRIFLTLQFEYTILAVIKKADGTFQDQQIVLSVAGLIHGEQLAPYPEQIETLELLH